VKRTRQAKYLRDTKLQSEKLKQTDHLSVQGRITLVSILRVWWYGPRPYGSLWKPLAGSYEHGTESSNFLKSGQFLNHLSDY